MSLLKLLEVGFCAYTMHVFAEIVGGGVLCKHYTCLCWSGWRWGSVHTLCMSLLRLVEVGFYVYLMHFFVEVVGGGVLCMHYACLCWSFWWWGSVHTLCMSVLKLFGLGFCAYTMHTFCWICWRWGSVYVLCMSLLDAGFCACIMHVFIEIVGGGVVCMHYAYLCWSCWRWGSVHTLCMSLLTLLEVGFCSCTVHALVGINGSGVPSMCCVCLSWSCWRLGSAHVQCMRQWSLSMKPLTDKIQTTCVVYVWVEVVGGWVLLMYSACVSDRYQWSHWPTRSRQHVLCMFEFRLLEVGFYSCTVHAAVIAINEAIDRQDPDNMCCVCLSFDCWRLGSAHVQCMRQWSLSMKPLTDKIQTTCVVYVWV